MLQVNEDWEQFKENCRQYCTNPREQTVDQCRRGNTYDGYRFTCAKEYCPRLNK